MKLKCIDGVVRNFIVCQFGDFYDGCLCQEYSEAYCSDCLETFGRHDTKILKPIFKNHICDAEKLLRIIRNETPKNTMRSM
jgi:hypothetical protein